MANKYDKWKPKGKQRQLDVFLKDRMEVIRRVAGGQLPVEVVSINLYHLKAWAIKTGQPAGTVHGIEIVERKS